MNLDKLKTMFSDKGCRQVLFKMLAANDNSKNQIYLGGSMKAANVLPFRNVRPDRKKGLAQSKRTNKSIFKAELDFSWLDDQGGVAQAPHAQLILYPQYTEVRFSGFLLGCKGAPSELMRERQAGRVLFMGICNDGSILGYTAGHDSPLAKEAESLELPLSGVFHELPMEEVGDSKTVIMKELFKIHRKGWIDGKRLSRDGVKPYKASNAGGYTLEAELGIYPNGYSEPDFMGWEVKQHKVSKFGSLAGRITLMTPEPTEGFYRDKGTKEFVYKYGAPDKNGVKDRLNFGGIHKVNERSERTGLILKLDGYDLEGGLADSDGGICLVAENGEIAAKWPFAGLILHWNRKHSQAVYVPAITQKSDSGTQYWYGSDVRLGEGTDVLLFLKAMFDGTVFYDPGIKVENVSTKPKVKKRNQFRIKSQDMDCLYDSMTVQSVLDY